MTIPLNLTAALADRYRIERQLGQGGMATVYLAEDLKHHRKVAIKVLRPELAAGVGPGRFLREIEVAAQLQHPNILPLHDSGTAADFLFYVMPYVEGESLADRLAREGELPIPEAIRILIEVTDALAYAHGHGVVHRDIKPANVMLSGRHALVADFGVAKAVSDAGGQTLTTAGVALGTPAYMAPEQAAGESHLDHRVDIYAIGVMAYELVTGRLPFHGVTAQQLIAAHITEDPELPSRYRAAMPPALVDIIMGCLAKRPADRWQGAAELLSQLEALKISGTSGAIVPARTDHRMRYILIGAGAVILAAVGMIALTRHKDPALVFGRRSQVTLDPGLEVDPAISPDGQFVAYAAGADARVYIRQVEGGTPIALATELGGPQRRPVWSPDGKRILFRSPRGIEIIPALGGVPRLLLADTVAARSRTFYGELMPGAWSPDGNQVVFVRRDSLFIAQLETDSVRLLLGGGELHSPAWSPDGRWVVCVNGNRQAQEIGFYYGNLGQSTIWIVPAGGGEPVAITEQGWSDDSPVWFPAGRKLLFVSNRHGGRDVYQLELSATGRPAGPPVRLTTGLNALTVSLSSDGRRIAYSVFNETSTIWTLPVSRGSPLSVDQARPITTGSQVTEGMDASPDGEWLVFDSDRSGNSDIYRVPVSGGEPEQLTNTPALDFWAAWSPDGREIAFHSFVEGSRHLFVMSADGRRPVQVTMGIADQRCPTWSPDGQALFFLHNFNAPDNEIRMVAREPGGQWGKEQTILQTDALPVVVSPDGRFLAYSSSRGLMLSTVNGDSTRVLVPSHAASGGARPAYVSWPAGNSIYYLALDSLDNASIWSVSSDGGTPRQLVRFDDPSRPWHRFGFDAQHGQLYFTLGDRQSDIWVVEVST